MRVFLLYLIATTGLLWVLSAQATDRPQFSTCIELFERHIFEAQRVQSFHLFKANKLKLSLRFLKDDRLQRLASDPDHGGLINNNGLMEAVTGLEGLAQNILPPPLRRGPRGSEFIDGHNIYWDVKTPISPSIGESWEFSAEAAGMSIKEKLDAWPGMHILLNQSFLHIKHQNALELWVKENISIQDQERIKSVVFDSPFAQSL